MEHTFLAELVAIHYGIANAYLQPMTSDSGKRLYRVEAPDGQRSVLHLTQACDQKRCAELARVLLFLEQQHYPAERIVPTLKQTDIGTMNGWCHIMTQFVEGTHPDYSPEALFALGAQLGRLHGLTLPEKRTFPKAGMLPQNELAFAQQQLASIADKVPEQFHERYKMLQEALSSLDRCENLPVVLLHNDYHPANAIYTQHGELTFIDWDGAGVGPAIIDLGFLLSNCDGSVPWAPLPLTGEFHPDKTKLTAVLAGYSQYQQLVTEELDLLPDAIRFRALVFGACHFASMITEHGTPGPLMQWWARYTAADEITDIVMNPMPKGKSS
ncbi:MAG TPA: phosphotransferase [Ktedonobacteraceae bacterium]|nr:phosphotransferase [Ktedonobacteraceae bacterium]